MNEQDLIASQDDQRTKRNFIALLGGLLGVNDQSNPATDGYAVNVPRNYQSVGINGAVGIEGSASSNLQTARVQLSGNTLLLLAVGAYFLLKK